MILKNRFYKKRNGYSWSASKCILKIVNIPSMLYHPFRVERDCGLPELSAYCCKILRIHHGLGIFIPLSFQSRWLTTALIKKNIKDFIRAVRNISKSVELWVIGLCRVIIQSRQFLWFYVCHEKFLNYYNYPKCMKILSTFVSSSGWLLITDFINCKLDNSFHI